MIAKALRATLGELADPPSARRPPGLSAEVIELAKALDRLPPEARAALLTLANGYGRKPR